ncbi:hypothetical protein [Chengkuizengella axinellae]|uniref:Uncharacterized protein n=1 Tax=Chengkuizengella axinellae TaxID=3064388 RepID=A0ABT9J6I0_9BACL|nr:hypothetical protein [Chengkuizengella sp. 2205SS18-9]MDP5277238.1 hypothetical protein [Chengkuizengella sp. 2205SS18-9]
MFVKLAEKIFNNSPFELALIGEVISGYINQEEITIEYLEKTTCILPINLQNRLGLQKHGRELSNQLRLFDFNAH